MRRTDSPDTRVDGLAVKVVMEGAAIAGVTVTVAVAVAVAPEELVTVRV